MDKKYLEDKNLMEARKRFMTILEYKNWLNEADGDENDEQTPPQDDATEDGGEVGPEMGTEGAPEASMGTEMGNEGGVPSFNPEGGDENVPGGAPMGPESDEGGEDVEEIDIDELTDSQEETEKKVKSVSHKLSGLDDKFEQVIELINKFTADIDANNAKIEDLKAEFEKRNPTNIEKMTLRSKRAYPNGETPDEYWEKKEAEGDYSTEDDNNGEGDEKYNITKSEVDNISNWKQIYDNIAGEQYNQSLNSILGY